MQRVEPGPGQESVWEYPRPPRLERTTDHVRVDFQGETIADSNAPFRVLETSHPPVYYIDVADVDMQYLVASSHISFCEYKGQAHYYDVGVRGTRQAQAAWYYPSPTVGFIAMKNCIAFYPSRMDACWVNNERVQAQDGDFYGGWITDNIVGPFKGGGGTWGW